MKHRMTAHSRGVASLLWTCVALFGARVIAQFEVLLFAPDWLPSMQAWYSGLLPYPLLLPLQIALLMIMAVVAWNRRVRTGRFAAANPRSARLLRQMAVLYFGVMALRLAVNVFENGAQFWQAGAIPVAFHWVLALFLAVSGRAAPVAARLPDDEYPHGDVPALSPATLFAADFSAVRGRQ